MNLCHRCGCALGAAAICVVCLSPSSADAIATARPSRGPVVHAVITAQHGHRYVPYPAHPEPPHALEPDPGPRVPPFVGRSSPVRAWQLAAVAGRVMRSRIAGPVPAA